MVNAATPELAERRVWDELARIPDPEIPARLFHSRSFSAAEP